MSLNTVESYKKLVYKAANVLAQSYPKVIDDDKYLNSEDIELRNIAVKGLTNFNSIENLGKLISLLIS